MRALPPRKHRVLWLSLCLILLALSVSAVAVRVSGYPEGVPRALAAFLDSFIEPGAALWWFAIGGVFQAFPSSPAGYVVAVAGNTALWLVVVAVGVALWKVGRRIARAFR